MTILGMVDKVKIAVAVIVKLIDFKSIEINSIDVQLKSPYIYSLKEKHQVNPFSIDIELVYSNQSFSQGYNSI